MKDNNFHDTFPLLYNMLETIAGKYNVGHLYKPERKEDSVEADFTKLILLLTNLGQGYEKKVIILLDNVEGFTLGNIESNDTKYENFMVVYRFIESFYLTIKHCTDDIHTVLALGCPTQDIEADMRNNGNLLNETNTPLFNQMFGITEFEFDNVFTDDLWAEYYYNQLGGKSITSYKKNKKKNARKYKNWNEKRNEIQWKILSY